MRAQPVDQSRKASGVLARRKRWKWRRRIARRENYREQRDEERTSREQREHERTASDVSSTTSEPPRIRLVRNEVFGGVQRLVGRTHTRYGEVSTNTGCTQAW